MLVLCSCGKLQGCSADAVLLRVLVCTPFITQLQDIITVAPFPACTGTHCCCDAILAMSRHRLRARTRQLTAVMFALLLLFPLLLRCAQQRKAGSGSSKRASSAAAAAAASSSKGDTTPTGDAGGGSLRRSARSHRATDRFKSEVSTLSVQEQHKLKPAMLHCSGSRLASVH
jgi:hypothetical protein